MLDVLHLLAVAGGLLERAQHEGRRAGAHVDGGIAVLAGEPAGDRQTLPVLGGLLDIITHLLGGHTEGTDFGGKRRTTWQSNVSWSALGEKEGAEKSRAKYAIKKMLS